MKPEQIRKVEDPFERYTVATTAVEAAQALVVELGDIRAAALTQLREAGLGLRSLAKLTGLSVGRLQEMTRGADTTKSMQHAGRPRKPAD